MLIAGLVLAACGRVAPPVAPSAQIAARDPSGVTVYMIYNHFHSDLAVPRAALMAAGGATAQAAADLGSSPWVALGYGDAKFYIGKGMDLTRLVDLGRSIVVPRNPAVMHLDALADPEHDDAHPLVLRITLPAARFADLLRRTDATFALRDGAPDVVHAGHGATDLFFAAAEPASAAHDCNQWLGEVMGRAGFPHIPLLDTASDGLAYDLMRGGRAVRVRG